MSSYSGPLQNYLRVLNQGSTLITIADEDKPYAYTSVLEPKELLEITMHNGFSLEKLAMLSTYRQYLQDNTPIIGKKL